MVGSLYFGALAILVAPVVYVNRRRNQPKEIAFDETPAMVREEVLRRVPGVLVQRFCVYSLSIKMVVASRN